MKTNKLQKFLRFDLLQIVYIALAIFLLFASPLLAAQWQQLPFIGAFLEPSMHFKRITHIFPNASAPLQQIGTGPGDKLIAVNGIPITTAFDMMAELTNTKFGQSVTLKTRTLDEGVQDVQVTLTMFSISDRILNNYVPLAIAVICLFSGLWIRSKQGDHSLSIALANLALSLAIISSTFFDYFTTHRLVSLFYLGIGVGAAALIHAAIAFLADETAEKIPTWLSYAGYTYFFILVTINIYQWANGAINTQQNILIPVLVASALSSVLFLILTLSIIGFKTHSMITRRKSSSLLLATLISFLPLLILGINYFFKLNENPVNPLLGIAIWFLPAKYAYQLQFTIKPQNKHLGRKMMINGILLLLFGLGVLVLSLLINQVVINPISPRTFLITAGFITLIILCYEPLKNKIIKYFQNSGINFGNGNNGMALRYAAALTATNQQDTAKELLQDAILNILKPTHSCIFLYDPEHIGFIGKHNVQNDDTFLIVPQDSNIPNTLEKFDDILYFPQNSENLINIPKNQQLTDDLGSQLFAPIPGSYGILGWAALGPKKNHKKYLSEEIDLLKTLTHQFAVVYERADAMSTLQNRLKEMETLNDIGFAINNHKDFDSLLIAIHHRIQTLFPVTCFSLVMRPETMVDFHRVFYYEQGKITISTSQPQSLGTEFPEKKAIATGDVDIITKEGTWLIVPLKIDGEGIGAISLGTHSEKEIFDRIDLNLVNSIANLVTGAIIKADLLQTTLTQKKQLDILNQVTHQLNATLNLDLLLNSILDGALEILNCSSGILMRVDETTNELVFEVTYGPIGTQMQGKRMPAIEGLAGAALSSQKPIINNQINHQNLWFKDTDPNVVTLIENILAVPLIAHGRTVGILELINKRHGVPFTQKDQKILEGFASQAAIAIHNASQYSKKDLALAKRVEELSIMQQIDRELNATHDLPIVLQATLIAALKHTLVRAGSIGIIDADFKYLEEIWQIQPGKKKPIPLEKIALKALPWLTKDAIDPHVTKQKDLTYCLDLPNKYKWHYLILSEVEDEQYISLILHMETQDLLTDEDKAFLCQLKNHALITLTNALLYEDLLDAIQDKNEFISFISHELKNPLTVIKGYSDILKRGMAGNINEEQEDYLTTIIHNVRRMNTFIKDLSDQSHIETKSLGLVFETTPVYEVVTEVLQSYAAQIEEKSLEVVTAITLNLPDVWCDRQRLIQILSNLLSNAIKYTPETRTIEVGAEHTQNEWDKSGAAEVVHFWVKDNGFGISPEDQAHLFEKFYRGSDEHIKKIPGTGLGLRISKSLAEMMGGKMWFESTKGKGSTFHFSVPI